MSEFTMEQRRENVEQWLKALRSGEYEQGKFALRHRGRFCCLGVACEELAEDVGVKCEVRHGSYFCYDGEASFLPSSVRDALGLKTSTGRLPPGESLESLTVLNDKHSRTFPEIADFIESHPKGLFIEGMYD